MSVKYVVYNRADKLVENGIVVVSEKDLISVQNSSLSDIGIADEDVYLWFVDEGGERVVQELKNVRVFDDGKAARAYSCKVLEREIDTLEAIISEREEDLACIADSFSAARRLLALYEDTGEEGYSKVAGNLIDLGKDQMEEN
jgi:hypothetical protein